MSLLALEGLLVDRLREVFDESVSVLTANDLAGVTAQSQHVPAVYVLYDGSSQEQASDKAPAIPTEQPMIQRWTIFVATRNVKQRMGSAEDSRSEASGYLDTVISALLGWLPGPQYRRLRMASSQRPTYGPGNIAYFPLTFTTRLVLKGEPINQRGFNS